MFKRLVGNQKGSILITFVLSLATVCAFAGLALDVGTFYVDHSKLQNGADAAAMAGAYALETQNDAAATTAAQNYLTQNNMSPANATITFPPGNEVRVSYSAYFPTCFLQVLGIKGTNISVVAAASAVSGSPFNYSIFSGSLASPLDMNGSNWNITGAVHSNDDLNINGSNIAVSGTAEAVKTTTIYAGNGNTVGSQVSGAQVLTTPDLSGQIETGATDYSTSQTWTGSDITLNNNICVTGNCTFSGTTNTSGTGAILATGSIYLNGSCSQDAGSGQVCYYAQNGNITINESNVTIDGILYAPNGTIIINGSNITINGRVIGGNTVFMNGASLTVNGGAPVTSLPVAGGFGSTQLIE